MKPYLILAVSVALIGAPIVSAYAGDAAKGARVYKKCVSCHLLGAEAKNRIGPHLNNIIGREIAGLADYRYSKAMQNYATTQKIWTAENLDAYLANPRKAIPGTRMSFAGLRKAQERADVIAYLRAASP